MIKKEMIPELCKLLFNKNLDELNIKEQKNLNEYIIDHNREDDWRSTTTYKGDLIDVSNLGNVRDHDTKEIYKIYYPKDPSGRYLYPIIYVAKGKHMYIQRVAQLVAKAFVPNDDPINKIEVNHIDGNKWNSWYKNLEWVTSSGNKLHAIDLGIMHVYGEDNPNSKCKNDQIRQVCEILQAEPDIDFRIVSERTGVPVRIVGRVFRRECWKQISEGYVFKPRTIGPERAEEICSYLDEMYLGHLDFSVKDLSELTGVSTSVIYHIMAGERWESVSKNHIFYQMKFGDKDRED